MNNEHVKIGVTGYFVSSEENKQGWIKGISGQQFSMFSYDFVESIIQSGALPNLLPIVPKEYIGFQLETIDALILAGGEDVHPKFYDEQDNKEYEEISLKRDIYEFNLLKQALKLKIPLLLVCRGMQLLNILQKGSLYKDINTDVSTEIEHLIVKKQAHGVHKVTLDKNSFVTTLLGEKLEVNSIHHQSIKKLGENLQIVGLADDGIVEAVTFKDRKDVIAVQWHPEMMYKNNLHAVSLFNWIVEKAKKNRNEEIE